MIGSRPCGSPFYVWAGDNLNNDPDCEVYNCDVLMADGSPGQDGWEDVLESQNRAWLDFSDVSDPEHPDTCVQPGCGAAELACWIRSDTGGEVEIPSCIAGDTGVKAGVQNAVDSRVGDDVSIPLYTSLDCGGVTCPGTSAYIEYFACVTVLGWQQQLTLPRLDGGNPDFKDKAIKVAVSCGTCPTYCGKTSGGPPIPGGIRAVSLIW
jgi:hypothetical protein